jgi:hypothetical protein
LCLADPSVGPGEETYVMSSPGAWGIRLGGAPFVRVRTDEGISGLSEIFSVPRGWRRPSCTARKASSAGI